MQLRHIDFAGVADAADDRACGEVLSFGYRYIIEMSISGLSSRFYVLSKSYFQMISDSCQQKQQFHLKKRQPTFPVLR